MATRHPLATGPRLGAGTLKINKSGERKAKKLVSYLLASRHPSIFLLRHSDRTYAPTPHVCPLDQSPIAISRAHVIRETAPPVITSFHLHHRASAHTTVQDSKHGALTRMPNPMYSAPTTLAYRTLMTHVYHDDTTPLSSHIYQHTVSHASRLASRPRSSRHPVRQ